MDLTRSKSGNYWLGIWGQSKNYIRKVYSDPKFTLEREDDSDTDISGYRGQQWCA